jgi:RNA polymerase I-specific transcription initiation factor RRN3
MDNAFVKSYIVFIGMLLSARPEYLSLVLTKITQGFTYRSYYLYSLPLPSYELLLSLESGLQALDAGIPESSSAPLTRRMVYDRLHYLLRHVLSLIPTLPSTLQPLLARNFPHKRQNQVSQITYIRNLLRVTEYCAELADRIIAIIVDRAIQIDVGPTSSYFISAG